MTFLVPGGLDKWGKHKATMLVSTYFPIFFHVGLPASVIMTNSLVHGAVLTARVTSPCWALPTATPEPLNYFYSCELPHSVLKFAF